MFEYAKLSISHLQMQLYHCIIYSHVFTIFQKWHKWHGKSYSPLNPSCRKWTRVTNLHTVKWEWDLPGFFFFYIKQHILDVMKLPVFLEFHDTENDNCNQKIYHMFMTFKVICSWLSKLRWQSRRTHPHLLREHQNHN